MTSFASPVFWQIRYLVQNLNKKNQKTSVAELNRLVDLYSFDAKVYLLACLIEEIDFRDNQKSHQRQDSAKVQLLSHEIGQLSLAANFGAHISQAVDSVLANGGALGTKSTEDFVSAFCKVLKLALPQQLLVGLGLGQSHSEDVSKAAYRFVATKLPDLSTSGTHNLPQGAIYTLIRLLQDHSIAIEDRKVAQQCLDTLLSHSSQNNPANGLGSLVAPLLTKDVSAVDALYPINTAPAGSSNDKNNDIAPLLTVVERDIMASISLANIMHDLGYGCTASVANMQEVFNAIGKGPNSPSPLTALDVAEALATMACTPSGLAPSDAPTTQALQISFSDAFGAAGGGARNHPSPGDAPAEAPTSWDANVFADAVGQVVVGLDFDFVIKCLDHRGFEPDKMNMKGFELIVSAYSHAKRGQPIDGSVFLGQWTNSSAQVALLEFAVNCSPKAVTFQNCSVLQSPVEGARSSPNKAWESTQLIESLLSLAEHGHYIAVRQIIDNPVKQYPELLLLGLLQVKTTWDTLREELYAILLPGFLRVPAQQQQQQQGFNNNADFATKANDAVLKRVWELNPKLLLRGVVDMYTRDPSTLPRVVGVVSDLHDGLANLLSLPVPRMGMDSACYASSMDPPILALDKWIMEKLNFVAKSGPVPTVNFVREILSFIRLKLSINQPAQQPKGVPITVNALSTLFAALQTVSKSLPQEIRAEIQQTRDMCIQVQPQLANAQVAVSVAGADALGGANVPRTMQPGPADDIEEQANAYFQKIYTSQQSIEDVIDMLKAFKNSEHQRERDIFTCMIRNLLDEYRFFRKYPERELQITGVLFGALIKHRLVTNTYLGYALRYVLDALRKSPVGPGGQPDLNGVNGKMFRFGMFALEQFIERLVEWPQYCSHIVQIAHLREHVPHIVENIEQLMASNAAKQQKPMDQYVGTAGNAQQQQQPNSQQQQQMMMMMQQGAPPLRNMQQQVGGESPLSIAAQVSQAVRSPFPPQGGNPTNSPPMNPVDAGQAGAFPSANSGASVPGMNNKNTSLREQQKAGMDRQVSSLPLRGAANEDPAEFAAKLDVVLAGAVGVDPEVDSADAPGMDLEDRVHFLFNNMSPANMNDTYMKMAQFVQPQHYKWLANFIVSSRVVTQANFHGQFMLLLEKINNKELFEHVRKITLWNVRKQLSSSAIVTSTAERSVVKNLGSWLGLLTLARDQPLLQRELDLKELLFDGYERGWLIAVLPFSAKILDSCKKSKVFQPPNPWVMGILRTMAELYHFGNLKLNLKFEIELLCKSFNVDLQDIEPSKKIHLRRPPNMEGNPDFNVKQDLSKVQSANTSLGLGLGANSTAHHGDNVFQNQGGATTQPGRRVPGLEGSPQTSTQPSQQPPPQPSGGSTISVETSKGTVSIPTETVIPNLAAYVHINVNLHLFVQKPQLKCIVPVAVDRAIREIIQPVVERSVTIACITSRELVLKDFAMESEETRMLKAAHLMVSNLAGALALVTCKEPLRVSMGNHLRSLLNQITSDQNLIEQVVQVCSSENLELGCMLIEKAATEKAMRDIDEQLEDAITVRKESRERTGQPYYDMTIFNNGRYPGALPEQLRPKPNGLQSQQLLVYEAFQRISRQPVVPPSQASAVGATRQQAISAVGGGGGGVANNKSMQQQPQAVSNEPPPNAIFNTSQALEKWRVCMSTLDHAVQKLLASSGGQFSSLQHLPPDHEIFRLIREMQKIGLATMPNFRGEAGMAFAQRVFKRLYETPANENFRLAVQFAVLEAIRDITKDLKHKITEWVMYAPNEHKLNQRVTCGLIRSHLLLVSDFDVYLSKLVDEGRQPVAVAFACDILEQCLLKDRTAVIRDFLNTLEILQRIANTGTSPNVSKLLDDIRKSTKQADGAQSSAALPPAAFLRSNDPAPVRAQVVQLLNTWIEVVSKTNGAVHEHDHKPFLNILQQQGVLKGDDNLDRFFRITAELCVESYLTNAALEADGPARKVLAYSAIDAFTKLVVLLVKYTDVHAKPALLARVLDVVCRVLLREIEARRIKRVEGTFDQRPYFRIFVNLQKDLTESYDDEQMPDDHLLAMLTTFAEVYHAYLQPVLVPGFAFSWLELLSHRSFMPNLLKRTTEKGAHVLQRLLVDLLEFMHPYLRDCVMPHTMEKLYTGTLRVLLVLLHDFPEFLCSFHYSFCDVIPHTCVQLRNLILSAFPRSMRLPDPFTPNLKVDLLPEISQPPRVLSNFTLAIQESGLRQELDMYLQTSQQNSAFLSKLTDKLMVPAPSSLGGAQQQVMVTYNVGLINSLVMYIGVHAIAQIQTKHVNPTAQIAHSVPVEILQHLMMAFDAEGKYLVLNAIANQLRFPNNHTHYFSCVLLHLFAEAKAEVVQEQITRVLLERLIVHRPHPWGLLITFIELIKNPRYNFWQHSFVHCAPEIDKLFESVARSCMQAGAGEDAGQLGGPMSHPSGANKGNSVAN